MNQGHSSTRFIIRSAIIGLCVALIIIYFKPSWFSEEPRSVVSVKKAVENDLPRDLGQGPVSYSKAVDLAAPAVVNIFTKKVITERVSPYANDPLFRFFYGDKNTVPRKRLESSLGSGVIASAEGYVVTNNHVIDGADEIQVALRDGRVTEAKLVGSDPESDVAVLKVSLPNLPSVTFSDSSHVRIGDVAMAIGNPFGVGQTVTLGIISATGRDRMGINTYENFIQTDAAINPGNSGGALINAFGQVIGINTAIYSKSGGSQGIGFAIPVNSVLKVLQQIVETGQVQRGYLGIEVQDIDATLAESFGLSNTNGAVVAGLLRDGPGYAAGLRPGDVITKIGDIDIVDSHDVMNAIAEIKPQHSVEITLLRNRKTITAVAEAGKRPAPIDKR